MYCTQYKTQMYSPSLRWDGPSPRRLARQGSVVQVSTSTLSVMSWPPLPVYCYKGLHFRFKNVSTKSVYCNCGLHCQFLRPSTSGPQQLRPQFAFYITTQQPRSQHNHFWVTASALWPPLFGLATMLVSYSCLQKSRWRPLWPKVVIYFIFLLSH